jgi:small subunit ribosomal protein S20
MANHFSALKRTRQTTKRTATNRANASRLRTALRTLRETIEKGDKQAAELTYRQTVSALDKAIQNHTGNCSCIHPGASSLSSEVRSITRRSSTMRLLTGFERRARSALATRRIARVNSRRDL